MDLKGTWDRGGFGPKATATGVHPASRAATGREAVPANHVRQRWESSVEFFPWCGFYQKRMRKDWLEQDYTYSEDRRALLSEPIRKQVFNYEEDRAQAETYLRDDCAQRCQ